MHPTHKVPCQLLIWACYAQATTPRTDHARTQDQARYTYLNTSAALLQGKDIGRKVVNSIVACMMLIELSFSMGLDVLYEPTSRAHEEGAHLSRRFHAQSISPLFVFGVLSALTGALIRQWAYKTMGRHFTFKLAILRDHRLITHGPYAYVRHPGYAALIMTVVGMFACELSAGSWWVETRAFDHAVGKVLATLESSAAVYLAMVVLRAPAEDRMLHERFGQSWEDWKSKVPYMLFPGIL